MIFPRYFSRININKVRRVNFCQNSTLLPFKELPFDSVEIDVETLPVNDTSEFSAKLWPTVAALQRLGKKSIFLKVSMLYAHYAPVARYDF